MRDGKGSRTPHGPRVHLRPPSEVSLRFAFVSSVRSFLWSRGNRRTGRTQPFGGRIIEKKAKQREKEGDRKGN